MGKLSKHSYRNYQTWQRGPQGQMITSVTGDSLLQWTDLTSGIVDPKWRSKIQAGTNATTPYQGVKRSVDGGVCRHSLRYHTSGGVVHNSHVEGGLLASFPPIGLFSEATSTVALSKFYRRANDRLRPFQGMVFIGELRQTLRMIKNATFVFSKHGFSYLSKVKRLLKGKSSERVHALADLWLELQFGWKPLIHDIADFVQAVEVLRQRKGYIPIAAKHSTQSSVVVNGGTNFYGQSQWHERIYTDYVEDSCLLKGAVKVEIKGPATNARVFSTLGFSLKDFVPALWELLPYSFLVDYFTNIGDLVEGAFFPKESIAWHKRSRRKTVVRQIYLKNRADLTASSHASSGNTVESDSGYDAVEVTLRQVQFERDVPNLEGLTFLMKDTLSPGKIANIAALIAAGRGVEKLFTPR